MIVNNGFIRGQTGKSGSRYIVNFLTLVLIKLYHRLPENSIPKLIIRNIIKRLW